MHHLTTKPDTLCIGLTERFFVAIYMYITLTSVAPNVQDVLHGR